MMRAVAHTPLSSGLVNSSIPVGSAVALTTATTANVAQKLLQPGSYLVWGTVDFGEAASTVTLEQAGITNTSATLPTQAAPLTEAYATRVMATVTATQTDQLVVMPTIITIASAVTIYLVAQATFSAGAVSAYGTLWAMQINQP